MHKRVRTSFRINSKGMLIAETPLSPQITHQNNQVMPIEIEEEENESSDH